MLCSITCSRNKADEASCSTSKRTTTLDKRQGTFCKRERLVSQKQIEELFSGSPSAAAFPLRVVYINKVRALGAEPVQVLVSVPKKRFHHAVDRNRVKRQIREAYRIHKTLLSDALPADRQVLLAFVWLSDRHWSSDKIEQRMVGLLKRVAEGQDKK